MIIKRPESEIKTNSLGTEFNIDSIDTETLTQMLLNLYSNVIGSTVRELISNAYDANQGSDTPVVVGIENNIFFVHDFGKGLSPEFMNKKYIAIGYSTKRKNEADLGYYGYGRLSPLTYTDQYYVVSVHEGVESKYLIYRDGLKTRINPLYSKETTNPSGLRVEVPIKGEWSWSQEIKNQCRYFKIKSNIIGDWEIKENDLVYWSSLPNNALHFSLGPVSYPIDFQLLDLPTIRLPYGIKIGLNENIYCNPSREALVYNDKSKKILREKVLNFIQDYLNEFEKELYSKNDWERILFTNSGIKFTYLNTDIVSYESIRIIYEVIKKEVDLKLPFDYSLRRIRNEIPNLFNTLLTNRRWYGRPVYTNITLPRGFKDWYKKRYSNKIIKKASFYRDTFFNLSEENKFTPEFKAWIEELRDQYISTIGNIKPYIEEFQKEKESNKVLDNTEYIQPSSRSPKGWVYAKKSFSIRDLLYTPHVFVVRKNEKLISRWHTTLRQYGTILVWNKNLYDKYKPINYKMTEIKDNLEFSATLKRLCTEAYKAKVLKSLNLPQNDIVIDLLQEVNPLLCQILRDLNWKRFDGTMSPEIQESLIEVGEKLGCFNYDTKTKLDFISKFEGLKYVRYFIYRENNYSNEYKIISYGLKDFKRIWKLTLLKNKNIIYETLADQKLFDCIEGRQTIPEDSESGRVREVLSID